MEIKIPLPKKVDLLVKPGEKIDLNTPLYKRKKEKLITIPISKKIRVKPDKIFQHLHKFVGDKIKKGEIIASKNGFFFHKNYFAETDGVIKEVNHLTGEIVIRASSPEDEEQPASVKGKVVSTDNQQLVVRVNGGHIFEVKTSSHYLFGGKNFYLSQQQIANITQEVIKKKILITPEISEYLLVKSETLGVKGFISSKPLPKETDKPYALIKKRSAFQEIIAYNHKYCLVIKKENLVYLYD